MAINHANFIFNWKITWPRFGELAQNKPLTKSFATPLKNVVYKWHIDLVPSSEGTVDHKFAFKFYFDDGPLAEIKDLWIGVEIYKSDNRPQGIYNFGPFEGKRGSMAKEIPNFDVKDRAEFQNKYVLETTDSLTLRIHLTVPLLAFNYKIELPTIEPPPTWLSDMFTDIGNMSEFSDVQLVSDYGKSFYAHRNILANQSFGLAAMFRSPASEDEKNGIFHFPAFGNVPLEMILKYFYQGYVDRHLALCGTADIIQVADFAEQFGLPKLKEVCSALLWQRVASGPYRAVMILKFADLHDDLKYLKDRALDVVAENFECLSITMDNFGKEKGKSVQEERLKQELVEYALKRLDVSSYI